MSCLYLSRISKTQLIQAINKFRENLIPLENRVQIDQKIAEVFDASIETQLPDTNHNINYENRVFLLRLDNRNELSEKARSILLTPLGISEALKVIFEFCDKGCFGFLTGDMSYELYEFLLRDLYRIDLRKHSVNVEIYKELTKFLSKEDLSLPKYGIKSMAHENPQALFLRELKIEEDSSRVSTELENNEVEFLSKRAFGLEVSTKKEEIIRLFKPFCEALKMEKGSLSENSSHAIYFEKLEVDQIATLCYKSILVLISPSVNEDYESVKIQLKDVISKIAADIKLQLGHIEKTQIIEEYNKIRVENHKKPIKDTFLLQRSNFKITENMKNHAINNENAIIDFATLVLNTMMKTSQIKDHFGDVVNGVTLIDSKKSSLRNSSGKVLFKTDFLKIILSKMGDIKKNETVVALEKTLPMIYPPKD